MKIKVKLFSVLRKYMPPGTTSHYFEMIVPADSRVINIIENLNIPVDIPRLILINGRAVPTYNEVLHDNDVVSLFPPMAGG